MSSLFGRNPASRAVAARWRAAFAVYLGFALVLSVVVLTRTVPATPLARAEISQAGGEGAETPMALPLTNPGMPTPSLAKPRPDLAKKTVLKRRAWMVQTDDWTDRLSGRSFWRSRSGGSSGGSRSYKYRSRSNRMSLGLSSGSSGSGGDENNNGNNDGGGEPDPGANEITGDGSEFYTGDGETYKTLCVRSCDGYFTPVSFSTTEDNFEQDAEICESRCGSGAKLYVFKNPGESPQDMVDLEGEPYTDLETAFLFKTKYIPSCTCKPHPWSQASRDRHKVYALKAATRGRRGKSRRLAKAALRKYKRAMRRRQQITRIRTVERIAMLAVQGGAEVSALLSTPASRQVQSSQIEIPQIETALSLSALGEQRRASLSPVRSLTEAALSPETQDPGATSEAVAVLVTPENDDQEIFLPVRNPMRVLSWLSRPRQLIASSAQPDQRAARALVAPPSAAIPRPSIKELAAAPEVAAAPVTPDNDDASIFLPVRNPIRVLSQLSRPVAAEVRRADLVAPSVAHDAVPASSISSARVVALSGFGVIHLPVRNPLRPTARLASRSTSRVELNLATGKTPEGPAPAAAGAPRNDTAKSAKRRRAGAKRVIQAERRSGRKRKRKKIASVSRRGAMRLGANSRPRKSTGARSRNRASRSSSGGGRRPSRSHWTKAVFTGLE